MQCILIGWMFRHWAATIPNWILSGIGQDFLFEQIILATGGIATGDCRINIARVTCYISDDVEVSLTRPHRQRADARTTPLNS